MSLSKSRTNQDKKSVQSLNVINALKDKAFILAAYIESLQRLFLRLLKRRFESYIMRSV